MWNGLRPVRNQSQPAEIIGIPQATETEIAYFEEYRRSSLDVLRKRRRLHLLGEKKYAKVRLDKEQVGSKSPATWHGEEEVRELHKRLTLARLEAMSIVGRLRSLLSKWRELVLKIRGLDIPRETEGEDTGQMGWQTGECMGGIAEDMAGRINAAIESWLAHCYELDCFHAIVGEKISRKAFDDEVEVPDAIGLPVAHMPRAWGALNDSDFLIEKLVTALEPLETDASSVAVSKLRSDGRVGEVTVALKQLKLVFDELS
ncbi:hypothetical protein PG999_005374 [Apiospora kogelbergensis]|uniref:Uncharacterized protein n=1 Tax=Apiospora kogelbergensis TaxID=1337665 RepID=A0AAW0R232_9PEZI